jgi:cation diffusion facilitator CzcD-associated flavoprotein CzcO
MAYSDFPMPADYPDYPHHSHIATYFDAYVDHFGFRDRITFQCAVTWAKRREDGLWEVTLETGEKRLYDALCVANGHHWDPRWPEPKPPGKFDGLEMHSHYYIDPATPHDLRGKKVVIVGFGNSALDLACELGRRENTDGVWLSVRRGYWVVPRYFGADVLDFFNNHPARTRRCWRACCPARWSPRPSRRRSPRCTAAPRTTACPSPTTPSAPRTRPSAMNSTTASARAT